MTDTDILIVGAGAAGLMAGIWAGRSNPRRRIVILDGARKLGAKILVAGGGRCNVTHDVVDETAYAGSSRNAIRKVLRRFDVAQTVAFFREIGVELKREDTGKLFPVTDDAHTVLDALLRAAAEANVRILHPRRVETIAPQEDGFVVGGEWGSMAAARIVLATGGRALPKSGSDGHGYALAESLGHSLTPRIFPALVPLILEGGHFLRDLSGISADVTLSVHGGSGKRLIAFDGSLLCTHFGLSGPVALDISRYYLDARADDSGATLAVNWLPAFTPETFEQHILAHPHDGVLRTLSDRLSDRLARALLDQAGIAAGTIFGALTREQRRAIVGVVCALRLPITGDRGYTYAEVTAGGIPLSEIRLETMESRACPGLHLCGEICDVDGRIGGYNFQWAWASGYVAGVSL
ncbi:MAG: aminoacetone oxidase family FAD-binding enzyme [Anaerolineae bacterium]|nr:aminoacetone oxidase family FAD-binding enzyme [Anaerolineae bacterium]